jgi:hypothetical protein
MKSYPQFCSKCESSKSGAWEVGTYFSSAHPEQKASASIKLLFVFLCACSLERLRAACVLLCRGASPGVQTAGEVDQLCAPA